MQYTKEYFIEKFEAIDEEFWTTGVLMHVTYEGKTKCCAAGFCGVIPDNKLTDECLALGKMLRYLNPDKDEFEAVFLINDGICHNKKLGSTPKERILNALKSLP